MKLLIRVELVVIIHIDERYGWALLFIEAGVMQRLRAVDPVLEGQPARIRVFTLHGHAHKLEIPPIVLKGLRLRGKARIHAGHELSDILAVIKVAQCSVGPKNAPLAVKQQRRDADAVHDLCGSG